MVTHLSKRLVIAIDPGASGGIATYDGKTQAYAMPDSEEKVVRLIQTLVEGRENVLVCIEKVGGFIGKNQPGSRMFNFGRGVGVLIGALLSLSTNLTLQEIAPVAWQRAYGNSRGITKTEWKNKLKEEAQKKYPDLKVTLKTADALLILDYARKIHKVPA